MNRRPRKTWSTVHSRVLVGLVASLAIAGALPVRGLDNGLARTPPMGWNSWNKFGCNISESLIKGVADAMVTSGMQAAGYQYVNLDDCWQTSRDSSGTIVADPTRFPSGIKALADYVHAKGLKLGVYTDAGTLTCAGRPGTVNHEQQDAKTYASWGVDYVKEDWCSTGGLDPATQYAKFRDALASSGRSILFSICNWGVNSPWNWGPTTGNMWRTTGDISDNWNSMTSNLDSNAQHASAAGPGGWNDPDMLEVGNGGMSTTEYRSHMSLWAIMAAPLIAGNDIRSMSQDTKDILMAPEVIAIDQDAAGVQGTKVADSNGLQVWAKKLQQTGAVAVALFNRSSSTASITANWSAIGIAAGSATVRDLWARTNVGSFTNSYAASVPSHGTVLIKVVAGGGDTQPPTAPSSLSSPGKTSSTVTLIWSPSTDNVAVTGYAIFSGTTQVGTSASTSGTVSGLTPNTTYSFTVKAQDAAGNLSTDSNAVSVTTSAAGPIAINVGGDATGSFVADAYFSGGSTYSNTATVTAPSGVPAAIFNTERYGPFTYTLPGYTPGSPWNVTLYFAETYLTAAGQRTFDVSINGAKVLSALDIYSAAGGANAGIAKTFAATANGSGQLVIAFTAGVENPKVNGIGVTAGADIDTRPPSTPSGLGASNLTTTSVTLSWSPSTDDVGVTGYDLYNGATLAASTASTSASISGLQPNTSYTFTVKAKDAAGNVSSASSGLTVKTLQPPDTQPPSAPSNLIASNVTSASATLTWSPSTDNVGVVCYQIGSGDCVNATSATVTNLSPSTTYSFSVRARDAAGNLSAYSAAVSVTTLGSQDTTPPTAPGTPVMSYVGMTVTLIWPVSTDDVGVVSYDIYYGSYYIGSTSDPMITLIGFKAGVPYNFTIRARDAAGNLSEPSPQITVLLTAGPDTTPPTAPTALTASSVTSSSFVLRWTASTDDVGVVVYQVLVNGSPTVTVTSPTATVSGLTPATSYSVTVSALDAAGNVSAPSAALSITTSP
jgi:chitodextrinase